ncbi:hypothetical protein FNH05_11840 [Amycolatopsis rhizosphaerae]|uniref:Uncharacterized protein n=1 Tax=Amycolatopsis rhizosphaerae TaxID=2053003 RepID=A0A558CXC4_9PSEU|nr:hypothetical protein [Amycolatopsis rhizosphaerae]TVT53437.1 hypothetical protein FNH05_11840 [Amycolatopsis rhizosphaerae]
MGKPDKRPPYWLVETCPTWCDKFHGDEDLVDDRRHVSRWRQRIVLCTMEPVRLASLATGSEVEFEPCTVQVWVEQGYREIEPRIRLEEDHGLGLFALSLDEADRLAQALAEAVKLGRSTTL